MSAFQDLIQFLQDGQLVNATNTNQAPEALAGNIQYLKDVLDANYVGQTLVARGQLVATTVNVGQPVYFNAVSQQFELALATVVSSLTTGQLSAAPSSFVWGVVLRKWTATSADILLQGMADIDLTNSVGDAPAAGMYYLSGSQAGKLVQQQPPVSVPVCLVAEASSNVAGAYRTYVNPILSNLLQGHTHYQFPLVCYPAGQTSPPAGEGRHTITSADATLEGWLPASHASFGGKAPAAARFGYNIAASSFAALWPPIPLQGAYLEWNKGEYTNMLGMGVPLGQDQLVVIDRNGIWWMSDCYDDVPWPAHLNTADGESFSGGFDHCPRPTDMLLTLWFSKPTFNTSASCVLSLTPRANSGLTTYCVDTDTPAHTGDLEIDFDLALLVGSSTQAGYLAVKQLQGRQLLMGPVVESVKSGASNVVITGDKVNADGSVQGKIVISVLDELNGLELPVETVRLAGAYEAFPYNLLAIGFDPNKTSTIYGRVGVRAWPTLATGTRLKFRFWVMARAAGSLPSDLFAVKYCVVPMPSAVRGRTTLPSTTYTSLAMNCAVNSLAKDQYVLLETAALTVTAGDTIYFTLTRGGSTNDPSFEVDVLRKCAVLVLAE